MLAYSFILFFAHSPVQKNTRLLTFVYIKHVCRFSDTDVDKEDTICKVEEAILC